MSIIIEDMTMPECCMKCPMAAGYGCGYMGIIMTTKDMKSGRHEDCPLIDLGKHGDLIDADELEETAEFYETIMDIRHHAKTVIKAEGK